MKARVIATGEIKSFYPTRQSGYNGYVDEQGQWYYPHELDFRNEGILLPEKEIVIDTIWLAREEKGMLMAFANEPIRCYGGTGIGYWEGDLCNEPCFRDLKRTHFPQITWQTGPIECEVTIKVK